MTRSVCQEVIALAAAGKLTAADITTALDANTVRLLGRLVQWLQAEPNDQLLLNTERSESLWQLLLLTLANLLKVLQPEEQEGGLDMDLIDRFKQQLQNSGGAVKDAGPVLLRSQQLVLYCPCRLAATCWRLPVRGRLAGRSAAAMSVPFSFKFVARKHLSTAFLAWASCEAGCCPCCVGCPCMQAC